MDIYHNPTWILCYAVAGRDLLTSRGLGRMRDTTLAFKPAERPAEMDFLEQFRIGKRRRDWNVEVG